MDCNFSPRKPHIFFLSFFFCASGLIFFFRSQNRASLFYTLGRFETGIVEGRLHGQGLNAGKVETEVGTLMKIPQWKINWGSSKSLDPGDVPVITHNGSGMVLEAHRSSTSSSK